MALDGRKGGCVVADVPNEIASDLHRLAVELSPSGLLVTDERGTIVLVNREVERLFGYAREELVGKPVEVLVPERMRAVHERHRAIFVRAPARRPMGAGRDLVGRRKDGSEIPIEIGLNAIPTQHGVFVLSSIVDLSERREAARRLRESEERLRQSQKLEAVGLLAGGIAHDFNNILHGILSHAELVRPAVSEIADVSHDVDRIAAAALRGRDLVRRILAFSRRQEIRRARIKLDETILEALELARPSLAGAIELRTDLDPETPFTFADETQIHQIVLNLVANAAHAMEEEGGTIEVSVSRLLVDEAEAAQRPDLVPGAYARIVVTDEGIGIAPDLIERIFEPFFTTKPVGEGAGLGLSVVHGIVKGHEGAIEVRERTGGGTVVEVLLPAVEVSEDELPERPIERMDERDEEEPRLVLVVDDEEELAALAKRILERGGFRVVAHTSSARALDEIRRRPEAFALLVTDSRMPAPSGAVLAREAHAVRADLPILMVSGAADLEDPSAAPPHGVRRVLAKPFTSHELLGAVVAVLGRS